MNAKTRPVGCWDIQPGDVYIIGVNNRGHVTRETREVLGVLARTPGGLGGGGSLLEVRAPDGNVHRSHMIGTLDVIEALS